MYVLRSRGCNFYPIVSKFGTQVGLVKIQVMFEDGLCRSYKNQYRAAPKNYNLYNF